MGIERYLCVGGIEIANPCRTLAYLRRLGSPCLVRPPSKRDCGCCDEWMPEPCTVSATAGFFPHPDGMCVGFSALSGSATWNLEILNFVFTPCPGVGRPPLPNLADPGWVTYSFPGLPTEALLFGGAPPDDCPPWATIQAGLPPADDPEGPLDPDACGFAIYRLTDPASGQTIEAIFYYAPATVDPDTQSPGDCVVSMDGGLTWGLVQSQSEEAACAPDALSATAFMQPGPEEFCNGLLALTGVGPIDLTIEGLEGIHPGDPVPPFSDPAWMLVGSSVVMPGAGDGVGACTAYGAGPPIGTLLAFLFSDLGSGQSLQLLLWIDWPNLAPGDLGGTVYSLDGGASWTPIAIGNNTFAAPQGIPGEFDTPATDDAPWYDPSVPESADLLGVFIEEAKLSSPWSREARQTLKGASLGPGRLAGRELTLSGWLYARTEAATAYGRQWLFEALAGAGCEDDCDLPDAQIYTHCERAGSSGLRTLKRVGLTSFDPEIEPEYPRACGFKFEAVLTAEVPELFLEPSIEATLAMSAEPEAALCNICHPCPDRDPRPCSCGALLQPPRVIPVPDPASSFCEPISIVRASSAIGAPAFWREATSILSIDAGETGLSNLRIRAWANPAGLAAPTAESDLFACQEPCLDLEISCVPPRSVLTIDGTTRRAFLLCEGEERDAYPLLSSSGGQRLRWPDVGCHGLALVADFDAANTDPAAAIDLQIVPRERG